MLAQDLSQYSDTRFRRLTDVRRNVFRFMLTTITRYESEFRAVSGRKSADNHAFFIGNITVAEHVSNLVEIIHSGVLWTNFVKRTNTPWDKRKKALDRFYRNWISAILI